MKNTEKINFDLQNILEKVSKETGVPSTLIKRKGRTPFVKNARHIYMYLARKVTSYGFRDIAEFIGKDHSTAIHSYNYVSVKMGQDKLFKTLVESILLELRRETAQDRIKYLKSIIWKYQQELTTLENL